MKLRAQVAFLFFTVALFWLLRPAPVNTQGGPRAQLRERFQGRNVAAGEVLVRLRAGANLPDLNRVTDADDNRPVGVNGWRRLRSASRGVQALLAMLQLRGDVLEVEPNYVLQVVKTPDDPFLPSLWGLNNGGVPGADIHAVRAWDVSTGSPATVVGVVDTGVDYTHPDLAANMWSAPSQFTVTVGGRPITCPAGSHGFNAVAFIQQQADAAVCSPADDYYHGTHTAGTVGASGNNGTGVVGVNWTTRIMALKFLDSTGSGTVGDAINAIDFALQTKAVFAATKGANVRVLSNSYGGGGFSNAMMAQLGRLQTADILFVAAAGNDASNNDAAPFYPASYPAPNVIAVAATDENDNRAGFSNYGPTTVHLGAPGNNILSTLPGGGYGGASGTSMATPHVAGAAALVLSGCALTTAQLKTVLLSSVDVLGSLSGLVATNGRLNVDRALRSCATVPSVTLTSPPAGATYTAPASIALAATASDPDGIARVDFYAGSTLIGSSTTSPYGGTLSSVGAGTYALTAVATDTLGLQATSAPVSVTVTSGAGTAGRTNVALATNGGVASASSTYSSGYSASGANNGDRKGTPWGNGGGWNDGTSNSWPDWLEVDFSGPKLIDEVDVFSVQDAYTNPSEPTPAMTFSLYGLQDFEVQYWTGTAWQAVPGGTIVGNTLVWRQVTFSPVTTTRIRIWVTRAQASWSRMAEVEAYGTAAGTGSAPTVNLTAPTEGASYTTPVSITLTATASDPDGTVSRVDFYVDGAAVAGVPTNPPQTGPNQTSTYNASWNAATGPHTVTAVATDNAGMTTTSGQVHVTVTGTAGRTNVALATNGGVASASSTHSNGYSASGAINGDRKGTPWGNGGGWNDGTSNSWPDWLEVDFNGPKLIDEVDVFSVQDAFTNPSEPTPGMSFSLYGLQDFEVQYWTGNAWQAVPGGTIVGNALVWRQVSFGAVTTTKIRIWVTRALNTWSRIAEVEAYGTAAGRTNVALAANGGVASASSTNSNGYAASGAINGDRKGTPWGNGGGWNDGTANAWPDWLQVDFNGTKLIDEVDVFSVQDAYLAPVEPTSNQTFTQYGLTDFLVQYWDGTQSQWVTVPGGTVTGNALVWRTVTFAPVTTSRIRVLVTSALATWSRITEVEAYGMAAPGG